MQRIDPHIKGPEEPVDRHKCHYYTYNTENAGIYHWSKKCEVQTSEPKRNERLARYLYCWNAIAYIQDHQHDCASAPPPFVHPNSQKLDSIAICFWARGIDAPWSDHLISM